jgi:hypothetical protein
MVAAQWLYQDGLTIDPDKNLQGQANLVKAAHERDGLSGAPARTTRLK